jgi:hypothetical protein
MECTGHSSVNGDLAGTYSWAQVKALTNSPNQGTIIKRNNGASYQIATNAGTMGSSEPSFSDTPGTQTTDNTQTWKCIGTAGAFTGGQAPHARLANACASNWFAAGNTIYVGDNHAESQSSAITLAPAGTSATIGKILCHNHSGSYPPASSDLTTGASVSTTTSGNFTWNATGAFYLYGITFKVGVGSSGSHFIILAPQASGNLQDWAFFDSCSFWVVSTLASNIGVNIGASSSTSAVVILNNTTMKFGATQHFIQIGNTQFLWQNTGQILASGSSVPSSFIASLAQNVLCNAILEALDLSQLTGAIIGAGNVMLGNVLIKDCKLNAAATITTPIHTGLTIQLARCDSAATAYKSNCYIYEGTETTETTITRVGGAVDPSGQAQTRKIVTTANSQWLRPFRAEPYAIWNTVTGATVTVTVYGTINAGALPNNDDIWIEVCFLGSSAQPLGTIITTTKSNLLASNAAVASDGSTWNGGGSGAGWSPFKLVATLSSPQPGMAGYIDVRVRAAKASTTYYIDPKIDLT